MRATMTKAMAAVVLVVASVVTPTEAAAQGGPRPKACGSVVYQTNGAEATTFSAATTVDVEMVVTLVPGEGGLPKSFTGAHELGLRVLGPGGRLYQELTVPFTTDRVAEGATRSVHGYPRPLKVQAARPPGGAGKKEVKVTAALPVGGTAISASGLYGAWSVEVVVDGVQYDCVTGRTFTITQ